jgi:hypothetical protein
VCRRAKADDDEDSETDLHERPHEFSFISGITELS